MDAYRPPLGRHHNCVQLTKAKRDCDVDLRATRADFLSLKEQLSKRGAADATVDSASDASPAPAPVPAPPPAEERKVFKSGAPLVGDDAPPVVEVVRTPHENNEPVRCLACPAWPPSQAHVGGCCGCVLRGTGQVHHEEVVAEGEGRRGAAGGAEGAQASDAGAVPAADARDFEPPEPGSKEAAELQAQRTKELEHEAEAAANMMKAAAGDSLEIEDER